VPLSDAASLDAARQGAARFVSPLNASARAAVVPQGQVGQALRAVFKDLPSVGGGVATVRLAEDNLEAWNARWDVLDSAKKTIDTQYFTLERDAFGFAYLGSLLHKMNEGVKVRLMIDAMADATGSLGFKLHGRDYLQELVGKGAEVGIYHPVWHRPFEIFSPKAVVASNHDKIIVADGKLSITGGRNIGRDYFVDPRDNPKAWRDTDILMDGAGPAAGLTVAFEREFERKGVVAPVYADIVNVTKRDLELIGAYCLMDSVLNAPPLSDADKQGVRAGGPLRQKLADDLVAQALARLPLEGITRKPNEKELASLRKWALELTSTVELRGSARAYRDTATTHTASVQILDQTAVSGGRVNTFVDSLEALTRNTEQSLLIENPYVVLTEEMIVELEKAAKRGVEITIVTNSPMSTDSAVTQAFFLEDWPYILARVPTARIFVATGERKIHAKSAVADDQVSLVSTYNLDLLSGYVNSEVGAVVLSPSFAKEAAGAIRDDLVSPANGMVEYKIKRDAAGRAVLEDGKPVVEFGPENHLPEKVLKSYSWKRTFWNFLRWLGLFGFFKPLQHPPLTSLELAGDPRRKPQ